MRVAAVHKQGGEFVIDSADLEEFKPAMGEAFVVDIARRRNVGHHRKAFALLRDMHANQDRYPDMTLKQFRKWTMFKAGYFTTFTAGDVSWVEPDSIAFDKLDQSAFDEVYQKFITVAVEELGQDWALTYA